MDEQKNGTPAPRRRRRADVHRTVISEDYTDSFQPEEAKPQEEARQPRSEVRKPAQSSVQRQVWEDEYDDFDDEPRRKKGGKKRGKGDKTGCLIGIIILLLIVIVVFALGWIVFPAQKDDILARIGIMATAEPTITPTIEPTATPTTAPTATPTAEPTATPTPSPSPTPSPTPKPSPTPVAEVGTGTVNRDAKLRADAVANAKVKKTIKKGESVTIHEAKTDSTGKLWYYLTVDDSKDEGWMRDYVVTTKQKISAPTPSDTAEESAAGGEETADSTEASANQDVIATAKTNRAANLRQTMGGKVLVQLKKGTKVNIYEQTTDKKGNVWYKAQAQNGAKVGYLRDYVVTLDKGAGTTGSGASTAAAAEDLQDREVIGKATTNRAANVREEPLANATVVRQLGNGMELQILAKYAGVKEETWYEVVTASGKTHGFVRDYVVYVTKLDKNAPTLTYEK